MHRNACTSLVFCLVAMVPAVLAIAGEPADLTALKRKYQQGLENIRKDAAAKEQQWNKQYQVALDRLMDKLTRAGNLDGALAVRTEKSRVAGGGESGAGGGLSRGPLQATGGGGQEDGFKFPRIRTWLKVPKTGEVPMAYALGPLPKNTITPEVLDYLKKGDFRKAFQGKSLTKLAPLTPGKFGTSEEHKKVYYVFFVRSRTEAEAEFTVEIMQWRTGNQYTLYMDGEKVLQGANKKLSKTGNVLLIDYTQDRFYNGTPYMKFKIVGENIELGRF